MAQLSTARTEERSRDDEARADVFIAVVTAVVILGLWIRPMFSSLWLDELGTWWVVKDGIGDAISRALEYHGQSPAYYVIAWAARSAIGSSEFALRLPSLIALLIGVISTYRLVLRLFDRETARCAVLTFAAYASIAFEASNARPYAFALAALIAATLSLVRWLDEGRARMGLAYVALATLAIWFHYLVVVAFAAHLIYAAVRVRSGTTKLRAPHLAGALVAVGLAVAPLAAQIASLWSRRESLTIPDNPIPLDLVIAIVAPAAPAGLLLGALIARWNSDDVHLARAPVRPGTLALLGPWLLVPPSVLFLLSVTTPLRFLSPRYLTWSAPAAAILLAWAIRAISPRAARRIVAVSVAILAVATSDGAAKYGEDWASAAAFVRTRATPTTPVLLHAAFIESSDLQWLRDPEKQSYLSSPVSFYPMGEEVWNVPYALNDGAIEHMDRVLERVTEGNRFILVTRYPFVPWATWIEASLRDRGWDAQLAMGSGVMQVWDFTRVEGSIS